MALEIVIPGGTFPISTSTSHEFPSGFGPAVMNPTLVDRSNNFHVHANFSTNGGIFALFASSFTWRAEAIFEQMGAGEFGGSGFTTSAAHVQTAATHAYALRIVIPGSVIPQGIYRVILKLFLDTGMPTTPACGFEDLGLVQFYN
jgi:hypothetical protein